MQVTYLKIKIFAFGFTFLMFSQLFAFGQLTQSYKNGFVAATNTGVWYLQDGFNEWVFLGNIGERNYISNDYEYDTISSISFYHNNLFVNGLSHTSQISNESYWSTKTDLRHGYKNNIDKNPYPSEIELSGNNLNVYSKITNKLKWTDSFFRMYGGMDILGGDNIFSCDINGQYPNSGVYHVYWQGFYSSMASDNDSTIVAVGTDNNLLKFTLSLTEAYRDTTHIPGLASNAASGHQICYNPDDDLFYIISDEGILYTYDKTTVVVAEGIASCDSAISIEYDPLTRCIFMGIEYNGNYSLKTYNIDTETLYTTALSDSGNIQIATTGKGKILFNRDNAMFLADTSDFTEIIYDVADLPSGTVVYDLDYIDYLPWVEPPPPCNGLLVNGECYDTIQIGTQTWMQINLHYDDSGTGIYSYNDEPDSSDIYGYLYTWNAAMRMDTLIEGWHLPSSDEFTTLINYLGGTSVAGGKLKETDYEHWISPNTGATNESGFTALPGGLTYNEYPDLYDDIKYYGNFWSSSILEYPMCFYLAVGYQSSQANVFDDESHYGFSVRLIKTQPNN
jgi:uncharacterized protein (TIGR02145 family)